MNRALRRAARCLTAAGLVLGFSHPLFAQGPLKWFGNRQDSIIRTQAVAPVAQAATDTRQLELDVELGWLSDPNTFACPLSARFDGRHLNLTGEVPNHPARLQAIQIARQISTVPVVDNLRIRGGATRVATGESVDSLNQQACKYLLQELGERSNHLQLHSRASGEIIVRGNVATPEERVQVSRALRNVRGATYVTNQVNVGLVKPSTIASNTRVQSLLPTPKTETSVKLMPLAADPAPPKPDLYKTTPTTSSPQTYHDKSITKVVPGTTPVSPLPSTVVKSTSAKPVEPTPMSQSTPGQVPESLIIIEGNTSTVDKAMPSSVQPTPVTPTVPPVALSTASLKKRVETAAGGMVKSVQVTQEKDGTYLLKLEIPSANEKQVMDRVLQLQEVDGNRVKLAITLLP